jgi:peptidyl-prolyl cis-trans isomerase C
MPGIPNLLATLACAILALSGFQAQAQFKSDAPPSATGVKPPADPSTELLHSAHVKLTRGDYDTQLRRLPAETRDGFGTNIDRINTLLRIILVDKTLAQQARTDGVDRDPEVQRKIAAESDRILAQAVMERNQAQWEKEFDARPNMEVAARERWLVQPDKYRASEEFQATQIKYAMPKYTLDEAKQKAADARTRILAGGDMTAIAKAESDDPAAAQTGGKIDWQTMRGFGDARLGRAVASLRNVGDLTRPIEAEDGVYLVRLDAKRPGVQRSFDDVKASIIDDLRKEYVDTMRASKMASIRNDPSIVVNQPAVEALVTRLSPGFTPAPRPPGTPPRSRRGKDATDGVGAK